MENPSFWWYLPGKLGIFMGYVSFREGTYIWLILYGKYGCMWILWVIIKSSMIGLRFGAVPTTWYLPWPWFEKSFAVASQDKPTKPVAQKCMTKQASGHIYMSGAFFKAEVEFQFGSMSCVFRDSNLPSACPLIPDLEPSMRKLVVNFASQPLWGQ